MRPTHEKPASDCDTGENFAKEHFTTSWLQATYSNIHIIITPTIEITRQFSTSPDICKKKITEIDFFPLLLRIPISRCIS